MNGMKLGNQVKKIFFTLFSQGILSLVSIIIGLGLPKFLSIEEYSRWQIYYFYVAYVNYLQFGFNDGIILNLSGNDFTKLPWGMIKRATFNIVIYLLILSGIIWGISNGFPTADFQVIGLLVFSFIPTVLMCTFSAVLLAGNKTYEYNLFNLLIKIAFVAMMFVGIGLGIINAVFYVWADILSKVLIVVVFFLYERKNMICKEKTRNVGHFIKTNCTSGIIVASTVLILGLLPMCGRVVLQFRGEIIKYAQYSFAISLLSIILTFTNAIGTVAFPMLKRDSNALEGELYSQLILLYDRLLVGCLWLFVVIKFVVYRFLPDYIDIMMYFPIMMAMCWPLGKIQSIIYPHYKLARKEKTFLVVSLIFLAITFVASILGYLSGEMLGLAVAALVCVLCYGCVLDIYYCKKIQEGKVKFAIWSWMMVITFVICGMSLEPVKFAVVYGVALILYYLICIIISKKK